MKKRTLQKENEGPMNRSRSWKDSFRDGMYTCPELRSRKAHHALLGYIVHKAHSKSYFCWSSQEQMARVHGCSVRNIKDLLNFLHTLGAVHPVRFADLPPKDQAEINALCDRPMKRNANVYYVSVQWARDVLDNSGGSETSKQSEIRISPEDRKRGSDKANGRRSRYAPPPNEIPWPSTNPEHEERLFLNAVGEKWGSPTSVFFGQQRGSPATDILIDTTQAEISSPDNGQDLAAFSQPSSQAEQSESLNSSLPAQHGKVLPHGYGTGEASARDPRPQALARPEGTEYDAARARVGHRRAS